MYQFIQLCQHLFRLALLQLYLSQLFTQRNILCHVSPSLSSAMQLLLPKLFINHLDLTDITLRIHERCAQQHLAQILV